MKLTIQTISVGQILYKNPMGPKNGLGAYFSVKSSQNHELSLQLLH